MLIDAINEGISSKAAEMKNKSRLMDKIVAALVDQTIQLKNGDDSGRFSSVSTDDETQNGCSIVSHDRKVMVTVSGTAIFKDIHIVGGVFEQADNFFRVSSCSFYLKNDADTDKIVHAAGVVLGECIAAMEAGNVQ